MSTQISLDYTPDRYEELKQNIQDVQSQVDQASTSSHGSQGSAQNKTTRLVAVSKLKPASDIKALYDAGYRHFGENYIQELVDKAQVLPQDIHWHFIGALQSNKAKLAAAIPNLYVLETLSSPKVASLLDKHVPPGASPLNVYIQINTSGEDAKSGIEPLRESQVGRVTEGSEKSDLIELVRHVVGECKRLRLHGLMTIGSLDASKATSEESVNPDFDVLKSTRHHLFEVMKAMDLQVDGVTREEDLELSMGMSADFVQAIKQGSDSVRVGTRIFGQRPPKKDAAI